MNPTSASTSSCPDLAGKTPILLLKTRSVPNDGYAERFSAEQGDGGMVSFEPTFVPVLEHQFLDAGLNVVRRLLKGGAFGTGEGKEYGGMIFTSQRAVEAFAALVEEGKGHEAWPHLQGIPLYTVGPATSRALQSIPSSPPLSIYGAETGNGEALAHFILEHYPSLYPEQHPPPPLLFLVGETRRDIIPKTLMDEKLDEGKRVRVDELVVYGTGVMESFEKDFVQILADTEGKMRWVVVFSPTGCEAMLRALGLLDQETGKVKSECRDGSGAGKGIGEEGKETYIATIGPTTRDYLRREFTFEPHVCAVKPSPEGVDEGIRSFLRNR